jgi:glycosyltransferase involved in cell wall biosynthesis
MTDKIQFSVIIPLYNKEAHIKRCIDSVLNQSVQDFEIIVVNDGSTDHGFKIVESIEDTRIKLIDQDNLGVSVARNRGIEQSNFNYIAFLDADDTWEPNHLSTLISLIRNYPEAGLFATAYKYIISTGETKYFKLQGIPPNQIEGLVPNFFKSMSWDIPLIWTGAVCIPKLVFDKSGGFTPGVTFNEDTELWIKISLHYPIAFSTHTTATYHLDSENSVCRMSKPNSNELPYSNLIQNAITNKMIPPDQIKYARELIAKYSYAYSVRYLLFNEPKKTRHWLKNAITTIKPSRKIKTMIVFVISFLPSFFLKPICNIIWGVQKR